MKKKSEKKYFATLGGVRVEIPKERAEQIKRLQKLIADQRAQQQADNCKEVEFISTPTAQQDNKQTTENDNH